MVLRLAINFSHILTCNFDRRLKYLILRCRNRERRRRQFAYVLEHHPVAEGMRCPVCGHNDCRLIQYYFEKLPISKSLCPQCFHLFGNHDLPRNISRARGLFDYNQPSILNKSEYLLIRNMVKRSKKQTGRFLIFGIGGNVSVLDRISKEVGPSFDIWCCDLIPRKGIGNYFETYQDESQIGRFDGICSSEVVEHLDNTQEAWAYMNRLLKPMSAGGGICCTPFQVMSHCTFLIQWS